MSREIFCKTSSSNLGGAKGRHLGGVVTFKKKKVTEKFTLSTRRSTDEEKKRVGIGAETSGRRKQRKEGPSAGRLKKSFGFWELSERLPVGGSNLISKGSFVDGTRRLPAKGIVFGGTLAGPTKGAPRGLN